MTPDPASTLHERSQSTLVDFLRTDLDLCFTMLQTARLTSDRAHYDQAVHNVSEGLFTIRSLMGRVQDPEMWKSIHHRADELERELNSLLDPK
jgi:hypothetical protein